MANFSSYYRVWQTSGNILLGSTRYYGILCAGYKITSVTPKRLLKTQIFEKKGYFSSEKYISSDFSRIIEYEKPQGTIYKGTPGIVRVILHGIRSFLQNLRGRCRNVSKIVYFPMKNLFGQFFLVLPSMADLR